MAPPAVGWHEPQPLSTPTLSIPAPPSAPTLAPPPAVGESAADGAPGGTKKSFSAAELDHVPRYIAPEDDHPGAASSPSQPRPVSAEWQPNELASFSGAEWVPPAMGQEEVAAYVAPKAVSTQPPRSPRNLIIAVAGVALVAGLGFGVNKALAPDNATIMVEPTTVETTAKASATGSTTISTLGATTVATRPATRAPGLVGAANAAGTANAAAAADPALTEDSATTTSTP
jgi:hypothetical protein